MMRRTIGILVFAFLSICQNINARAAQMADLVLDTKQVTPTVTAFRNANFAVHFGGLTDANGIASGINAPRYEYVKPFDYSKVKWLLDYYHETVTVVPGTNYVDVSKTANQFAIIRAVVKRVADPATKASGVLLDCGLETAAGQGQYAADFVRRLAARVVVMRNTGDCYSAANADSTTPAGRENWYAQKMFIQVGVDYSDGRFSLSQFGASVAAANWCRAHGKDVVVGVFDLNGAHADQAKVFLGCSLFVNSDGTPKPGVYGHYNVSYSPTVNVGLELPGGKAVTEPIPQVQTGLLSPLTPLGTLYAPADNWWNLDVSAAPLDPNNAAILTTIASYESTHGRIHPDFGNGYGIPYCVVDGNTPLVPVTLGNTAESDAGYPGAVPGYPIPAAAQTDARYIENGPDHLGDGDRHLLIYDRDRRAAFELSYASYSGGRWSAGYGAVFKLDSNYRRPEGWTSTDAAGLCVLAGLVRYDELYLSTEPIRHATRVSLKQLNRYVWPASHTGSTDPGAPPLGTRFRLKSSFNTSAFPAPLRRLFDSWKTYGLIVADRGGNGYVQGTLDARWDNAVLNPAFHSLVLSRDFDVIKLGWRGPNI